MRQICRSRDVRHALLPFATELARPGSHWSPARCRARVAVLRTWNARALEAAHGLAQGSAELLEHLLHFSDERRHRMEKGAPAGATRAPAGLAQRTLHGSPPGAASVIAHVRSSAPNRGRRNPTCPSSSCPRDLSAVYPLLLRSRSHPGALVASNHRACRVKRVRRKMSRVWRRLPARRAHIPELRTGSSPQMVCAIGSQHARRRACCACAKPSRRAARAKLARGQTTRCGHEACNLLTRARGRTRSQASPGYSSAQQGPIR
jgi:hypothetical protein